MLFKSPLAVMAERRHPLVRRKNLSLADLMGERWTLSPPDSFPTITYFGTYALSEADRSMAIHVDGSSFPNWNGADLKRIVAITGDQLTLTVPLPGGESVDVAWKRAK